MRFKAKAKKTIRNFFEGENFIEVDTPLLIPYENPDENVENVPVTFKDFKGITHNWFLHTSPEFPMKRLIAKGFDRIYQMEKVFRNGEITKQHNVEFTMVEWYRTSGNFLDGMKETEKLIKKVFESLNVKNAKYMNSFSDIDAFDRITVDDAFTSFAGVNDLDDEEELKAKAGEDNYETSFFKLLVEKVEPSLSMVGKPIFLYLYPERFSAMSMVNGNRAERFELYISGIEIANGYTELTDYDSYLKKFAQKGQKAIDKGFLNLIQKKPLSSCEGVALGFERLMMVLTGMDIDKIVTFPASKLIDEVNSLPMP